MPSCKCKAAAARIAATVKSLVSRTLRHYGGGAVPPVTLTPGCFSVYVGPERARFVVAVKRANHPLFRRLLDGAELEYGYAAQGPIALPGCEVGTFHDVLWQMEERHDGDDDDDSGGEIPTAVVSSPVCGLWGGSCSKGESAVAGYRRMLSPTMRSPAPRWLL